MNRVGARLTCPWCRYDITGLEPEDGTITCPECGHTCTTIEARGAAKADEARPAAFVREAIIGGSVGMLLGAVAAAVAWRTGHASGLIAGVIATVWAGSAALGTLGIFVAGHRSREHGELLWVVAALSAAVAWIAIVHAVAVVLVIVVVAAL